QPVGRSGVVNRVIRVLPPKWEPIEQPGPLIPYPVGPPGRDARIRGQDPFERAARTRPIGPQPLDGAPRHDLDRGTSFVEQRGILDRALSATDHNDVPSLETTEVSVLGGMRDQVCLQPGAL